MLKIAAALLVGLSCSAVEASVLDAGLASATDWVSVDAAPPHKVSLKLGEGGGWQLYLDPNTCHMSDDCTLQYCTRIGAPTYQPFLLLIGLEGTKRTYQVSGVTDMLPSVTQLGTITEDLATNSVVYSSQDGSYEAELVPRDSFSIAESWCRR